MKGKTILSVVCLLSLLLNGYFIYHLNTDSNVDQHASPLTHSVGSQQEAIITPHQATIPVTHSVSLPSGSFANKMPESQSNNRGELLAHARDLLAEEHLTELRLFLRDYLQQYPLDMDFLLLEAQLNVKTELLSDAIAHYYSLNRLPMTGAQNKEISDSINELSSHTIAQLQRAYSWDTLAIFVEPLLQLEPQNRLYILALAEAYAQQNQFNLMENILASLDFDDPAAQKIRQLTATTSTDDYQENSDVSPSEPLSSGRASSVVQLQQVGDQYIVAGQLAGNSVALLIDTGASITAISVPYFQSLNRRNIRYLGRFSVNTASGQVLAPMYQFSELKLNHAIVENISVMVLPMRNIDNINGLLGMNFLREFDFKIDQRQSQLLLKQ